MVKSINFSKPAWCGDHFAGLRPEQGLQPVTGATALRRWFSLETTSLSIEQVATAVGFRSASVLREHFGGIVGTTPLAYRRAFGNAESAESRCAP